MAPPCGLTCAASSSRSNARRTARDWDANASLSSMVPTSLRCTPVRSSSRFTAGTGPMPMTRGATPALAMEMIRAMGTRSYRATASSEAISNAAAPSLTPEELPAVIDPPGNSGRRPARARARNNWVTCFERALKDRLWELLGKEPSVWRDERELSGEHDFTEEIKLRLSHSAILVTVVSPSYL